MRKGFTLVELLVVIAILGILMAMMVPAAGTILKRAKMAQAKGDAGVVVTVMSKYQAEYNRWPAFATNSDPRHLTDVVWVQAMSPTPGTPMPPSNPKRIVFFEPGANALEKTTGAFVDPWGHEFAYRVDVMGGGTVLHPNAEVGGQIPARVVAWSGGPDGDPETWDDNAKSWE